ncbi:phosphotransferase enzyme family protein [Metarhizium album ARSEF 1941]|uniref:Phosphotransferase enzyme family protein n=1 Tax=Metarhizium album (strain ARSEF 1941) TaxID=1081103 RepID=A0A0B2WJQ2_METAS|nr:phosphotransferase enzyme family protein [Metarhizium album ARSEF 1941]KHN93712.1 phosphotransferase enzyme family protein [Metarhizium album ARSEF 1941]
MLSRLYRFILTKCKLLAQRFFILWGTILPSNARFPFSPDEIDDQCQEFIDSVDEDEVCALASLYNNQKPCRIASRPASGSFNVCFFVEFFTENKTWVVRVPIEPAIKDTWAKVQSEVATMQYVQRHTSIPIPRIYAHGRNAKLIKNSSVTQAFLILEYIPGRSLKIQDLIDSAEMRRKSFYAELIKVLSELRKLEFPIAGSLMPDPKGGPEPVVSNTLSMASNDLEVSSRSQVVSSNFTSTTHFVHHQFEILMETYRLPAVSLSRETAELETFALDSLGQHIHQFVGDRHNDSPYLLAHADLRCSNIIIDDELHIQAVIDWDWANVVPRKLFTLPPWITGHDLDAIAYVPHRMIMTDFSDVLRAKQKDSSYCREALEELNIQENLALSSAQILRHPSCLIRVYYKFIFPKLFRDSRSAIISSYFQRNKTKAMSVRQRLYESMQYTKYLREKGVLRPDENITSTTDDIEAWLAKARAIKQQ